MNSSEARDWIRYACDCNGCPEIAGAIRLEWSSRMTSCMGKAVRDHTMGRSIIRLSTPLYGRATCEQQRDTVIHEACHVIAGYQGRDRHGRYSREGHGAAWKACMRRADCKPDRCHTVDCSGLRRKRVRHEYTCVNDCKTFRLTAGQHKKMRDLYGRSRFVCAVCKGKLVSDGKMIHI